MDRRRWIPLTATALIAAGSAAVAVLPQQTGHVDLLTQANVRIDGPAIGEASGYSVAGAGDLNGDGRADLAIGANVADNSGRSDSGSTYVIFGQPTPTTIDLAALGSRGFRIDGAAAGDESGRSVAGAGDINGDGRADLAIGAPLADSNGRTDSGSSYIIYGQDSPSNLDLNVLGTRGFRIDGAAAGDFSGWSVAGVGDINADGKADFVVGTPFADSNMRTNSGSTYVIYGQATPTAIDLNTLGAAGFRIDGAATNDGSGWSVAGVGDINGDGRADLAIGAPLADSNMRTNSGSTYVIYGQAAPTNVDLNVLGTRGFRIDGAATNGGSGRSVAGVGDINGDGRADLAIGAVGASNNGRLFSGSTYVIYGQAAPTNVDLNALGTRGFRTDGAAAGDDSGWSVAGAGDMNGDGRADLAIGARSASNKGRNFSGSTYLVYGFGTTSMSYGAIDATVGFPIPATAATITRTGTATLTATNLPLGLTIDPATGTISGTPPTSGNATATVAMTDLVGTATATVSITIRRCVTPRSGTNRRNVIRGDNRSEVINGRGGNDVLLGGANEDCIAGGPGNDTIAGGAAFDTLTGGPGNDVILGGSGSDTIKGGPGRDTITAGKGNDTINTRDGATDTINCGPGRDTATVDRSDTVVGCETVKRR